MGLNIFTIYGLPFILSDAWPTLKMPLRSFEPIGPSHSTVVVPWAEGWVSSRTGLTTQTGPTCLSFWRSLRRMFPWRGRWLWTDLPRKHLKTQKVKRIKPVTASDGLKSQQKNNLVRLFRMWIVLVINGNHVRLKLRCTLTLYNFTPWDFKGKPYVTLNSDETMGHHIRSIRSSM